MPSFYRSTQMRQMPLTPPDHYGVYQERTTGVLQQQGFTCASQNAIVSRHELSGRDGSDLVKPHPQFPTAQPHPSVYAKELIPQLPLSYVAPPTNSVSTYPSAHVPLLPPIRVLDRTHGDYQLSRSKRAPPVPPPKEEKAVGGVAAHLDYEMEQMASFVAEMAQGMYALYESRICLADIDIIRSVNPNSLVPPAFRKYVLQVLSSTRLPRTTILLGLHYLASRMTMLSTSGRYTSGSGQVYRMLVTSFLLGSKFLDDNTFQNRSWSEVSNIPVTELNVLEIEWLLAIDWNLHVDSDDPQGFILWQERWNMWQVKNMEISMDSLKLTSLDRNIRPQRSVSKHFSPNSLYPPSFKEVISGVAPKDKVHLHWLPPSLDQWSSVEARTNCSPPSAPETGPNTPEWYCHPGGFGYGAKPTKFNTGCSSMSSQSLTPVYHGQYPPHYISNGWSSHGLHCGYCLSHQDHYFMAPGNGPQPVAG